MFPQSAFRSLARLPTTATRSFSSTPRASFARMQIIGRLGADPELIDTSTGRQMVRYSLATNYGPVDNRQTSWFRISAFLEEGARRNYLMSLQKGTLVHVDADAQNQTYIKENGEKGTSLNLIHRSIDVLRRPYVEGSEGSAAGDTREASTVAA